MKRRTLTFSLLSLAVIFVAVTLAFLSNQPTKAATLEGFSVTLSCTDFTSTYGTLYLDRQNTVSYDEAYFYQVFDGAGNVVARYPDSGVYQQPLGDTQGYGGVTLPYNMGEPKFNPLIYQFVSVAGMGLSDQVVYTSSGVCDGLPFAEGAPAVGQGSVTSANSSPIGVDMVAIPETAVVGMFLQETSLYFAPRADALTDVSMAAGQTLWVYGVNESGEFYQVMMGGRRFWVPMGSMGPNNDATWNGTPLPTTVVG